jgi:hypothetical protein
MLYCISKFWHLQKILKLNNMNKIPILVLIGGGSYSGKAVWQKLSRKKFPRLSPEQQKDKLEISKQV